MFADRTVSAKAAEVKFVYQQVKLFPDVKGVKVINKRLFESTADLILNVELLRNGECVARRVLDGLTEAQSEAYFELDFEKEMEQPGEYIVQAAYCLKEDTLWEEAGYELMTGRSEAVFVEDTKKKKPAVLHKRMYRLCMEIRISVFTENILTLIYPEKMEA